MLEPQDNDYESGFEDRLTKYQEEMEALHAGGADPAGRDGWVAGMKQIGRHRQ